MTKTILVPVDGSDNAERAVAKAADMARQLEARLIAVHVMRDDASDRVPPELREYERLEHAQLSERSMLQAEAEQVLRHAEMRAEDAAGVRPEALLKEGDVAGTILDLAAERDVDLIVMGSRGLGTLKGLLLGSISQKVSQLCRCDCLIVK